MVIQISVDGVAPLMGSAASERGGPIAFTGWFELLRAVSMLVESGAAPGERVTISGDPGQQALDELAVPAIHLTDGGVGTQ